MLRLIVAAYWPSIRKYRWLCLGTILCMIAAEGLQSMYPYYIRSIVDAIVSDTPSIDAALVSFWGLVTLLFSVYIFYRVFEWLLSMSELLIMKDLDVRSFAVMQKQSMHYFQSNFAGSLLRRITRFRNAFEGLADGFYFQISKNIVQLTIVLTVFFYEYQFIGWAFLLWVTLFLWMNVRLALWKYPLDAVAAESDSTLTGVLADSIANHATVKSYSMERSEDARLLDTLKENFKKRFHAWAAHNIINTFQAFLMITFELSALYILIRGWEQGVISVGDFVFFQSYIIWIFHSLWDFGNVVRRIFNRLADAEEMAEIYAQTPDILDSPTATPLTIPQSFITFENVSFSYPEMIDGQGTLHDLSLTISPDVSTAFVGHSGAGKSTIVKLLMRYFDVTEGSISIDEQDIRSVTQESLRRQIALVPQDPEIFHRTIAENIAFAKPEATEEEIIDAARRANAWEFIKDLPEGLQTIVGERGLKLSGGQRQRIALARAFLVDAKILILDEATSALDSVTEKYIQDAIGDLLKGRTSIVIAHRLSTIMRMERIVVLEEGRIAEMGTHEELIAKKGVYANLWEHQSGGYIS